MGSPTRAWPAVLAVVASALLFALNGVVSKITLATGMSATRLVELRTLGSAVVITAIALVVARRAMRADARTLAALAVLGVIGIGFVQWLYFVAISRLPVGLALLIEYTAPLMVALWARFVLREAVRPRVWVALVACLTGLTMVGQVGRGFALDAVGLAAAVGAAVSLATYYLLGEKLLAQRDRWSTQAWSMIFAAAFWAVLQPVWLTDTALLRADVDLPGALSPGVVPVWLLLAWIVLLGTVTPYVLVLVGLSRLGAARTGLLGMLEPVAASAAAWVVLSETMTALQVLGASVVLVGVVLAETARLPRPDPVDPNAAQPLPDTLAP